MNKLLHPRSFTVLGASVMHPSMAPKLEIYNEWLSKLARILRSKFDRLYFIPDKGTYVDFAKYFKLHGGEIIACVPFDDNNFKQKCESLNAEMLILPDSVGWSYLNTHFVGLAKYSLCLCYSSGSILEICSSKYLNLYENKKITFFIDERFISNHLPLELENELNHVIYFQNDDEIAQILKNEFKNE